MLTEFMFLSTKFVIRPTFNRVSERSHLLIRIQHRVALVGLQHALSVDIKQIVILDLCCSRDSIHMYVMTFIKSRDITSNYF